MTDVSRRRRSAAVALFVVVVTACGGDNRVSEGETEPTASAQAEEPSASSPSSGTPSTSPEAPAPTEAPAGGAAPSEVAIDVDDFRFEPGSVEVAAGGTVTWTNVDGVAHTVTADDGTFDLDVSEDGQTVSATLADPGTYRYVCEIHASMTGSITVR